MISSQLHMLFPIYESKPEQTSHMYIPTPNNLTIRQLWNDPLLVVCKKLPSKKSHNTNTKILLIF
jgi:hypothetical protein